MVHELVHTAWNWATAQFEIVLTPSWSAKLIVVGLFAVAVVGAALLYHFVEEPARIWMRRMVKAPEYSSRRQRLTRTHDATDSGARKAPAPARPPAGAGECRHRPRGLTVAR